MVLALNFDKDAEARMGFAVIMFLVIEDFETSTAKGRMTLGFDANITLLLLPPKDKLPVLPTTIEPTLTFDNEDEDIAVETVLIGDGVSTGLLLVIMVEILPTDARDVEEEMLVRR